MLYQLALYIAVTGIFLTSMIFSYNNFVIDHTAYKDKSTISSHKREQEIKSQAFLRQHKLDLKDDNLNLTSDGEIVRTDKLKDTSRYKEVE